MDRYKEEYGKEHKVEILLYRSRHQLNDCQKYAAEQRTLQQDEIKATKVFEENKARFMEMDCEASDNYIKNLSLGDRVKRFLHEQRDAEKYFKEHMNCSVDVLKINRSTMYNKIQCGNLQEGVKKIVLEMFQQRIGQSLH